jgi:hypothetical protein
MAARQATSQSLKSIGGASLFALGFVVLFANLDGVAASLTSFSGISAHEALGLLPTLGLAALHAAQAYAFDQDGFISGFLKILVLFWPLILILAGALLLCDIFRASFRGHLSGSAAAGER